MRFTLTAINDDGDFCTKEFEADVWTTTLPHYLDFLRGAGFVIDNNVELYTDDTEPENHSKYYYNFDRNKV